MSTLTSFGPRQTYTQADLVNNQFSQLAATDGLVMATLGSLGYESAFLGLVSGNTSLNGQVTSTVIAAATTQTLTNTSKKGTQTIYVPLPGSFTMPVRAGETWNVMLTADAAFSPVPDLIFFWIPDGEVASAAADIAKSAQNAATYKALHDKVMAAKS
jgi:hypothetical protein